jgi:hypothetical protein
MLLPYLTVGSWVILWTIIVFCVKREHGIINID